VYSDVSLAGRTPTMLSAKALKEVANAATRASFLKVMINPQSWLKAVSIPETISENTDMDKLYFADQI
jgi:hypothetical protein